VNVKECIWIEKEEKRKSLCEMTMKGRYLHDETLTLEKFETSHLLRGFREATKLHFLDEHESVDKMIIQMSLTLEIREPVKHEDETFIGGRR